MSLDTHVIQSTRTTSNSENPYQHMIPWFSLHYHVTVIGRKTLGTGINLLQKIARRHASRKRRCTSRWLKGGHLLRMLSIQRAAEMCGSVYTGTPTLAQPHQSNQVRLMPAHSLSGILHSDFRTPQMAQVKSHKINI